MDIKEVREWVQLIFVVVGGVLALCAYFQNLKQRRVENALKFIALFKEGLKENDMHHWIDLLRRSSESAGATPGKYAAMSGGLASIDQYFSEGSEDDYAISRMAQSLDVVCHQIVSGVADAKTVYYEIGQLISFMHYHLSAINSPFSKETFLQYAFPSIHKFFRRYERQLKKWPSKVLAYVE